MTAGLHAVNLGNPYLNVLRGTNITAPGSVFVKLHTGDPGSAGTSNASANTTRPAITWAAAAAGSMAMNGTAPSWLAWASGTETITHVSLWDNATAGNFLASAALAASKLVNNTDNLALATFGVSVTPIAA